MAQDDQEQGGQEDAVKLMREIIDLQEQRAGWAQVTTGLCLRTRLPMDECVCRTCKGMSPDDREGRKAQAREECQKIDHKIAGLREKGLKLQAA